MAQQTEKIILEAVVRNGSGSGPSNELRRQGAVPGVVYGEGKPSVAVQVNAKELSRALNTKAGSNVLITLRVKGATAPPESLVLIKELQHHALSHGILHVDFHQVSLTKRITVNVPLAFKGESPGVKKEGGVLEHLRWDIEVSCLPTEIPPEIPVDISGLELNKVIHVKEIAVPPGVKVTIDPELPVITCIIPKEEVLPTPAEAAAAETTEPEVIKQKKPEELAAEEAEGKQAKPEPKAKEAKEEKKEKK